MVQNAGQTQAKMYQLGHQKGTYVIDVYACDFRLDEYKSQGADKGN
jgi:hypothetical protein